ncbi:BTB And Kelch, partial [Cooperia oncophora]
LKGLCCEFLKENLGLSNCLEIHATADAHSCQELFLCAEMYIVQNFQKVAESENFNQLSFDRLVKLISREELNVQSEEQVFAAVTRWVRFEQANRQNSSQGRDKFCLLEHVRLASCHPKFLVGTVSKDPLVMNDATCRHLLDEAKYYQLLRLSTDGPLEMQGTRFKIRESLEPVEVLHVGMANIAFNTPLPNYSIAIP